MYSEIMQLSLFPFHSDELISRSQYFIPLKWEGVEGKLTMDFMCADVHFSVSAPGIP